MEVLTWKLKGLFGFEVAILKDRLLVGMLKQSVWSNNAYGEVRGRMLRFSQVTFLPRKFRIKDIEGVAERGSIDFKWLRGRADIVLDGKKYTWEKDGWFGAGFRVRSEEGDELKLTSDRWSGLNGTLEFDYIDPAIFLVGFYILGVFRKRRG